VGRSPRKSLNVETTRLTTPAHTLCGSWAAANKIEKGVARGLGTAGSKGGEPPGLTGFGAAHHGDSGGAWPPDSPPCCCMMQRFHNLINCTGFNNWTDISFHFH